MTEWEYFTINLSDLPFKTRAVDILDDAGKYGWELITITSNNVAYLKRPVDQSMRSTPTEANAGPYGKKPGDRTEEGRPTTGNTRSARGFVRIGDWIRPDLGAPIRIIDWQWASEMGSFNGSGPTSRR